MTSGGDTCGGCGCMGTMPGYIGCGAGYDPGGGCAWYGGCIGGYEAYWYGYPV